jgi:hypothetical protein
VWRCLAGAGALVAAVTLALPAGTAAAPFGGLIAFHLALLAVLVLGALFDDGVGRVLRGVAAAAVLLVCPLVLLGGYEPPGGLPGWVVWVYPLAMALLLVGYGLLLTHRPSILIGVLLLGCWLAVGSWWGYRALRRVVTGLDHIALSLILFALAVLVSVGKSGFRSRWLPRGSGQSQRS